MRIVSLVKIFFFILLSVSLLHGEDIMGNEDPSSGFHKKVKKRLPPVDIDTEGNLNKTYNYDSSHKLDEYRIDSIDEDFAYVNISGLKVGQSGIIVNKDNKPIIIATAIVVDSDQNKTKLEFERYDELKQDAIPDTNLEVKVGDYVIMDYLYETSMLIAPNSESFQITRKELSNFNFIHPDLFGSYLKVEEEPIPTKEIIQKFAIEQNLGSIIIVVENKAYQVDSRSFKVINIFNVEYEDKKFMSPFFTRVEDIITSVFDFGSDTFDDYTEYYKELLDIK